MKALESSHRGSALLIVLGMLSFMVISAVGFSIYMRQGRVPSSYLRRNVSSRYLVKAALANAIEDLDGGFMSLYEIGARNDDDPDQGRFFGIHDDPYPGIGTDMNKTGSQTGSRSYQSVDGSSTYNVNWCENGDLWFHRVFCPFGLLPHPNNNNESLREPPMTVPTLTLEALAYLPPAIIDDVRKVSRMTRTAQWRSLPYEAGRYAYTAVNVSDMFDVNRLRADVARNSGPDRIALSALCAQDPSQPTTVNNSSVDALELVLDELETKKVNGNETPFTSLADFNLVAGGVGSFGYAPFMDYIGKSSGNMVDSSNIQTANGLFVTDTWFPGTNGVSQTVFDLSGKHQPFNDFNAQGFLDVGLRVNSQDDVGNVFLKNLGIGICALYDYLDSDNVPISLALPTTEAVPMVVGVGAPVGIKPSFGTFGEAVSAQVQGLSGTVTDGEGERKQVNDITITRTCQRMGISSFGNRVIVKVLTTYPFKRMKTTNRTKSFSLRGLLRIYVAPTGMKCRAADPNEILHPKKADWDNSNPVAANGIATFRSDPVTISAFNTDVTKTEEAIDESMQLVFSNLDIEMPLYWNVKEENPTSDSGNNATPDATNYKSEYKSLGNFANETAALRPLTIDGGTDQNWVSLSQGAYIINRKYPEGLTEFDPEQQLTSAYRIYASVWVQVLDGSKVVDMVPATVTDDAECLDSNVPDNGVTQRLCGDGAPTLNFMASSDFSYKTAKESLETEPEFVWKSLYAVDPRFNYAPEDWFATGTVGPTKSEWMSELGLNGASSTLLGQNGRDRDIFMFVSDQEYLQSVGELQFLPAISDLDGNASFPQGDLPEVTASLNPNPFSDRMGYAASKDKFTHREFFWRTYSGYPLNGESLTDQDYVYRNPYRMKSVGGSSEVKIESGSGGFKLNPFSEDIRVVSAAVIGTPFDYYVASTNYNQRQSGGNRNTLVQSLDCDKMMTTYSFGQSSVAQMTDTELTDIVDTIRETFSGMTKFDMNTAWGSLDWQLQDSSQINDQNKKFLDSGLTLQQPLHGVDRKYLYSFWRECFDNRQQLFLIFVRAEPTAIGGGASGSVTSAQLGGRAVALVWRDPAIPSQGSRKTRDIYNRQDFRDFKEENAPHRTRVLFYHQFD